MARDYYQTLGLGKGASAEEIKKAYRKMAMEFHPDRNPGKEKWANEKFKEINEAYAVLADLDKKEQYDRFGHIGHGMPVDFRRSAGRSSSKDVYRDFGSASPGYDFIQHLFDDSGLDRSYVFQNFGGTGKMRWAWGSTADMDGAFGYDPFGPATPAVRYELLLSRQEARRGTLKYLSRNGKTLEVRIPKSVKTGNVVKLSNALNVTDGHPGDILIQVKVH